MAAAAPTLDDRRTKAAFDLYKELGCLRDGGGDGELTIDDVGRLDVEKMMARALDCVAAVCEAQRVRVALSQPLKLREDGEVLTSAQQSSRNKVFGAALRLTAKGLAHDDAARIDPVFSMEMQLLNAFPDSGKLTDGRGWLSMHWAIVADEDKESGVTEADVMAVYETDPMALRKHHLVTITDIEASAGTFGYTPAHMLCDMETTEKNMSLVRQLSMLDPRAFTMQSIDNADADKGFSALHVACFNPYRTEALLRLLVQLDPSQMKSFSSYGGPLGLLCENSGMLDERQFGCLVEADSSVEVVHDAICRCLVRRTLFPYRLQIVAKLLEADPAAAQHKGQRGRNLAHLACFSSDNMAAGECIEVLKLLLAHHKDALKDADDDGHLPAHIAAAFGPEDVLDFVLGEYPGAATAVENNARNLLHIAAREGPMEHRAAKARLLCARYPTMMLQRDNLGRTPLFLSCCDGRAAMALLLCEASGREVASISVAHPTDAQQKHNGQLPLHRLLHRNATTLAADPLSEAADAFRLLLSLYPEAAGIEGGVGAGNGKTPYRLAVEKGLPVYYLRLLLRAAPHLDPAELRRLNWEERRLAMFVAFAAVARVPSLLIRLRAENKDLVKHVVSFL